MQVLFAIWLYGCWLWPLMTVFGMAHGIKRLMSDDEKYWLPLLAAAVGFFMSFLPLYCIAMTI